MPIKIVEPPEEIFPPTDETPEEIISETVEEEIEDNATPPPKKFDKNNFNWIVIVLVIFITPLFALGYFSLEKQSGIASENQLNEFRRKGKPMILRSGSYWIKDDRYIKTFSMMFKSELHNHDADDMYERNWEDHVKEMIESGRILTINQDTRVTAVFKFPEDIYPDILFEEGEHYKEIGITAKKFLVADKKAR